MFFWIRNNNIPACKHEWVLNDVYTHYTNAGVEVIGEDMFILYCNNCKREKHVDEFDYNNMKRHGLIKG